MLTASEFSKLTESLFARSASHLNHEYIDPVASLLVERLGFKNPDMTIESPKHQRRYIETSQWIDRRVQEFFQRFPTSLGIEVMSGLSTRFHRLSFQSDWPTFRWKIVNTESVHQCLNQVLTKTDNLELIGNDSPNLCWCASLTATQNPTAIIILGEEYPITDADKLLSITDKLHSCLGHRTGDIELVISHQVEQEVIREQLSDQYLVLNELTLTEGRSPGIKRYIPFRRSQRTPQIHLIHLKLLNQGAMNNDF